MDINEFKNIRLILDNIKDQNEMSRAAQEFIEKYKFQTEISNNEILFWYLKTVTNKEQVNLYATDVAYQTLCQNLYLLDRTIPYLKDKQRPEWQKRILFFPAASIIENYLDHKVLLFRGTLVKLRFTRASGSHDIVHSGPGTNKADFYIYPNNKAIFIEYKFANKARFHTVQDIYKAYKNGNHLHNSKVLIALLEAEQCFYMIDFEKDAITRLDFEVPISYLASDVLFNFQDPIKIN